MRPASCTASRNLPAIRSTSARVVGSGSSTPGISQPADRDRHGGRRTPSPRPRRAAGRWRRRHRSYRNRWRRESRPPSPCGCGRRPRGRASSSPSPSPRRRQPSARCRGAEPMVVCSRCDLFQTGITSAPRSAAIMQARSCAFAWWAKRSPTPTEYFASVNMACFGSLSSGLLSRILSGRPRADAVLAEPRPQHVRHDHRAVGLLPVFEDRQNGPRHGDGGAVERVDEARALLAVPSCSGRRAGGPGSRCSSTCWSLRRTRRPSPRPGIHASRSYLR